MISSRPRQVIFLSHFTHDAPVANALKRFIEDEFAHAVEVFVSANPLSLRPGDPWEKTIRRALKDARVVLSLLSSESLLRPWIYFEAGAAWYKESVLIPMLHRGLGISDLPLQFQKLQTVQLQKADNISRLISRIQEVYGLKTVIDPETLNSFLEELRVLGQQIDIQMQAHETFPHVSFTLYSKTKSQEQANRADAGSNLVASFRKPSLARVFSALLATGQAYTNIVSLDEFWIGYLVEHGRLERIKDPMLAKHILEELQGDSHLENEVWALPHFLDFSYYAVRRQGVEKLSSLLGLLVQRKAYMDTLNELRETVQSQHLLAYDFNTPDTVAAVVCEFIESAGSGIISLGSRSTVMTAENVFALQMLRDLVGKRPQDCFVWGKPLNLDSQCDTAAFLRHWHSMASDEPNSRGTHQPMFNGPFKGTFGGWFVGILAHPPYPLEGHQALQNLFNTYRQWERFKQGAGLPTLAQFYHDPAFSSQRDPILHWPLEQVLAYIKRSLFRRSCLQNYPFLRDLLAELHNAVLSDHDHPVAEILSSFIERFPKGEDGQMLCTAS